MLYIDRNLCKNYQEIIHRLFLSFSGWKIVQEVVQEAEYETGLFNP